MRKETPMIDAADPVTVQVKQCHIIKGKKKQPDQCMIALAMKDAFDIDKVAVHRNIVWVKYRGQKQIVRYQSTPATRSAVAAFDKTLKTAVKLGAITIPKDGISVVLRPPRAAVSLKQLRSSKMKAARKESAARRKNMEKRPYQARDALTLEGVRNSQGYKL